MNIQPLLSARGIFKAALGAMLALGLAACGGGGGSAGTTIGTTPSGSGGSTSSTSTPTITLALVDAKGAAKSSLTMASPLTARATVKDKAGLPVANAIVAFATEGALTVLSPQTGRALTNADGVATLTLAVKDLATAQSQAGAADSLTAAVSIGEVAYSAKANFSIGATAITLRLVTPNPSTVNLKAYDTTPIKVEVLADGALYTAQPIVVSFSSACASGKADLPATATTINGAAQVVYRDKGCSATDTVTASVPGAPSVTASLVVAPPVAASIGFVSGTPSDKAIVIQGAGGNGRSETAVLTFQALDTFGQPLPNQLVNFALNPSNAVSLQSTSATTGADGKVIVAVNSGTQPTTFRVIATLASGQSTISDTITVTTGQPIQAAFSLSAKEFNIDGWNYDNVKTTITALIADVSGNPVADGTPVVFQTDSGAIGSSALGGCLTVNGGCTVEFRSQEPRFGPGTPGKRPGVATVSVSSTSARATLSGQLGIFLSGASAQVFKGGALLNDTSRKIKLAACSAMSFEIEVTDNNFNPMPTGTKIESDSPDKVSILNILPNSVPSIAPPSSFLAGSPDTTARQSSTHVVIIKPDAATCNDAGTADKGKGSFGIKVTSPFAGVVSYFPFTVTYPSF